MAYIMMPRSKRDPRPVFLDRERFKLEIAKLDTDYLEPYLWDCWEKVSYRFNTWADFIKAVKNEKFTTWIT
jgi:hypothetical protein